MTPTQAQKDAANIIESFLNGTCGPYDWDDFTSLKSSDPIVEEIRKKCMTIPSQFPPKHHSEYCNTAGVQALHQFASALRSNA